MAEQNPFAQFDPPAKTTEPPNPFAQFDPPSTDKPSSASSFWTGLKHGAQSLFYGGAQLGARMGDVQPDTPFYVPDSAPDPERIETVDKAVSAYMNDPAYKAAREAHPYWTGTGDIAGEIATTAPLYALPGGLGTLPARMVGAGLAGTVAGAARPVDTETVPVGEQRAKSWGEQKELQVPLEALFSAFGQPVGEAIGAGLKYGTVKLGRGLQWLLQNDEQRAVTKAARAAAQTAEEEAKRPEVQRKAAQQVTAAFDKARKSGLVAGDVIKEMADAEAAGQPLTLMDVDAFPGSSVRRQVGNIYRSPGGAGRQLEQFQKGRTYGQDPDTLRTWQGNRLYDLFMGIRDRLSSGSAKEAAETIAQRRSATGKPLWDDVMEGRTSQAPFERRLEQQLNEASQAESAAWQRLREAQTKLLPVLGRQQTAGNVYAAGAANAQQRATQREFDEAGKALAQARQAKNAIGEQLKQAHSDRTAGVKGAVWSPKLQRLLDNPDVRPGLARGYRIERNRADASGTPFNPHDYAIVGTDNHGNPIVGKVANMKLIQMAKEGLDSLLEQPEMRDPLTRRLTKTGQSIDGLRRELLAEGDRLEPAWKEARRVWAGHSAELEALADGRHALDRKADWTMEEFTKRWNEMEPGQREMFKLGAIDKLIEDLDFGRLGGDQSKAIINNPAAQQKLRLMFGNDAEFNRAMQFVTRERTMWETGTSIMRGAQTAERLATDEQSKAEAAQAILHAGHGFVHFAHGRLLAAAHSMRRAASHIGWGEDPSQLNLEMARLYTDPQVQRILDPYNADRLLIGPQGPAPLPPMRYSWGSTAGRTAVGDISGYLGGSIP